MVYLSLLEFLCICSVLKNSFSYFLGGIDLEVIQKLSMRVNDQLGET
jgi:hypothetical protein